MTSQLFCRSAGNLVSPSDQPPPSPPLPLPLPHHSHRFVQRPRSPLPRRIVPLASYVRAYTTHTHTRNTTHYIIIIIIIIRKQKKLYCTIYYTSAYTYIICNFVCAHVLADPCITLSAFTCNVRSCACAHADEDIVRLSLPPSLSPSLSLSLSLSVSITFRSPSSRCRFPVVDDDTINPTIRPDSTDSRHAHPTTTTLQLRSQP